MRVMCIDYRESTSFGTVLETKGTNNVYSVCGRC
ncbi:hypothetical protein BH20BAC1_BH20BAC1_18420 [soil metagenome]